MMLRVRQTVSLIKKIFILSTIFTIGCASIEYRSDAPKKNPLVPLTKTSVIAAKDWTVNVGKGIGRYDVKLLLANAGDVLVAADADGLVMAIDRHTGKKLWQQQLKMSISAGPTIKNKTVIIGGDAVVVALNSKNGEVVWKTPVTSEVLAAPKIQDDVVFVCTLDGGLTALNINDGHQLWRFALSPPSLVLRRSSAPVITKDYIVAGFANGKLVAINKIDSTVNWSADVSMPKGRSELQRMIDISADLVVQDDIVYVVGYQGNLTAFALHTGQIIWEREVSSYAGLVVDKDKIYVSAANGDLLAFDCHTGNTAWLQKELHGRELSKPVIQRNFIVVCDEEGHLHWLDKQQGQLLGRYKFTNKTGVEAPPVIYDDLLYVYSRDGQVGKITVKFNN